MIDPIHSSQGPEFHRQQDPQEKQRMFELQWGISLLGIYLSATSQNGHLEQKLSNIKKGIASGESSGKLQSDLNSLIDLLNRQGPKKAAFSDFHFLENDYNHPQALQFYIGGVQQYLNALQESQNPKMPDEFQTGLSELQMLSSHPSNKTMISEELPKLVAKINLQLPESLQIPELPQRMGGERPLN